MDLLSAPTTSFMFVSLYFVSLDLPFRTVSNKKFFLCFNFWAFQYWYQIIFSYAWINRTFRTTIAPFVITLAMVKAKFFIIDKSGLLFLVIGVGTIKIRIFYHKNHLKKLNFYFSNFVCVISLVLSLPFLSSVILDLSTS